MPSWLTGPAGLTPDFYIPTANHHEGACVNYGGDTVNPVPNAWGELFWGADDFVVKQIWLVITNDNTPKFNKDIALDLLMVRGDTSQMDVGEVNSTTVTILYNNYPPGALDDTFNPDFSISTPDYVNNHWPGADNDVYSLLVQSNNQTVLVGKFSTYNSSNCFGIARINANGQLDHTFNPGSGVPVLDQSYNYFISCIAQVFTNQFGPANQFVIGGNFPSYNGQPRYNIARVNMDGSLDMNFITGSGANGTVWAAAPQPDGKVLIGGEFSNVRNSPRAHIARLNTDGSLDATFDPGTNGPNGIIRALAITPSGQVYIGGEFTLVNGLARPHIAMLEANGVVSTNFAPVVGADGPVRALALQPDGKLLIGGEFRNVEFTSRTRIARYNADGSLDTTFNPGTGVDDTIYSIVLQPDGRIIIGGYFTEYNETPRSAVARLFASGELDTGFMDTSLNEFAGLHKPYFNPYANPKNYILTAGLQSDGNLMIGGHFKYVGGGRGTGNVQTNSIGIDLEAYTRAAFRDRANIARLVGGDSVGPGSIGLALPSYQANEDEGSIYTRLVRANGSLGEVEATFSVPPRLGSDTNGIAQVGNDYQYNRVNPRYTTSWNGTRDRGYGIYGVNNVATDPLGNTHNNTIDLEVTLSHLPGYQGDRSAQFQLDMPSYLDVYYLGGQNIPLGCALAPDTSSLLYIHEVDTKPGVIQFSSPNVFGG